MIRLFAKLLLLTTLLTLTDRLFASTGMAKSVRTTADLVSVDAVISNCVINLSPDKPQVWREIARVLKPGGRVPVSDLALLKPLPPAVAHRVEALVGCVAGAVLVSDTDRMVREAGLGDVVLKAKPGYVDGMVDWQDPLYQKIMAYLPAGTTPSDYITSLEVTAQKPSVPVASAPAGVPKSVAKAGQGS
ncbi:MAG: methyltransferase domain-containing protein [Verrucomicrobia bacterium]|nr:methyltransferase domain-containing protein [Verrucomicrobiota bacterium]